MNPGKYDTYKGSTLIVAKLNIIFFMFGKYDTYKGSTRTMVMTNMTIALGEIWYL